MIFFSVPILTWNSQDLSNRMTYPKNTRLIWGVPVFGILSIIGGFVLLFTLGTFYSFGNMMTYMVSYMRQNGSPNITYEDFVVVQSTWGMTQGVVMPLSGFLISFIGPKASMLAGATIFGAGCALTQITIKQGELWMVAATYGFVSAFGQNIALVPTLTTAMEWFPNRKGTAMGIVVGGFGGGAFVFNQVQTAIVNPDNVAVATSGINKGYFTDPGVLERTPYLLLILGAIYFVMGITGSLLVIQPPHDWLVSCEKNINEGKDNLGTDSVESISMDNAEKLSDSGLVYNTWKEALMRIEFYLLWITRLSVVLITQVVAALYKAFGQTFIYDDFFLSTVGSVASFFNCSGRLIYGLIMDKTSYKMGMSIEASLLTTLVATFYLTSLVGQEATSLKASTAASISDDICMILKQKLELEPQMANVTLKTILKDNEGMVKGHQFQFPSQSLNSVVDLCNDNQTVLSQNTSLGTKVIYAIWVWGIFVTFPGTYAMQPAVTSQTFGHK